MSNAQFNRPSDRYGSDLIRPGLLPGLLGSGACLAGLWASGTDWMIMVLFAVSILSAIMVFFCIQAARVQPAPATRSQPAERDRRPLVIFFGIALAVIVIVYNPISPFVLTASGTGWQLAQVAAGAVMFFAGVLVRTPAPKG
ncbi:MAG: hypothetical protein NTY82_00500 [Actinobacteria bacterium]|nr:hypothetical protein [Actinomycetota bacterium]